MEQFVGRVHELEQLEAELRLARMGKPRVVLLEGAAGMGKSWLVRQFIARAGDVSAVQASGDEAESRLTCGVVDQLFASANALSSNLPGRGDDAEACQDPLIVGAQLLRLLGTLQSSGPVLVLVDDAQWADLASLQALAFALRRLQADHVLGLVATREATDLPEGLRRLAADRGGMIRIGGLQPEELGQLAGCLGLGDLPPRALQRLWDHTNGNPLHARALLEELPPQVLRRSGGSLPAPRSFGLLVLSRLAALSEDPRRLVEAASILGARSHLALVAGIAEVQDPARALDEAVSASLLEMDEQPTDLFVAFPHSMVRAAVYDHLGPALRSALHARAGQLLTGPRALRHRAAAALVPDAALASELAQAAEAEAGRGDLSAAAHHLLAAARLEADAAGRERHLLDAVGHLLVAGEIPEANARTDDLLELPETARRDYVLGHLAFVVGRQSEAERLLRAAWEKADPLTEAGLRAVASEQLASLYAFQVRPQEAIAWARRAVEASPSSDVASSALTTLVLYLALTGRPGEALPLVEHLPEDPAHPTSRDMAGILGRGIVRMWIADLEGAHADLGAVLKATHPAPASRAGLLAMGFLAQVEYLRGNWAESVRQGELAEAVATDGGQVWLLPLLHATASWALGSRGEWQGAEAHVQAAKDAALVVGDAASAAQVYDAEARLAFSRGDHQGVVAAAERLLRLPGRAVVDEPAVFVWRELYADTLVDLGDLNRAAAILEESEDILASRPRRRLAWASAARVRGRLEAARSDTAAARDAFERGLSYPETAAAPFERALLEEAYGRFLRRMGERGDAATRLRAARDAFTKLGARPFLERAETELAACGLAPRRRSAGPQLRLTPQELAVAQLVAQGRTNRDVSEALTVSHKTVEYHLANIFTKLGISSRRHLRAHLGSS